MRPSGSSTEPLEIIRAALATRPFAAVRARGRTGALRRRDADPDHRCGGATLDRRHCRAASPHPVVDPDETPADDAPPRRPRGTLSALAQIAQLPLPVAHLQRASPRSPTATCGNARRAVPHASVEPPSSPGLRGSARRRSARADADARAARRRPVANPRPNRVRRRRRPTRRSSSEAPHGDRAPPRGPTASPVHRQSGDATHPDPTRWVRQRSSSSSGRVALATLDHACLAQVVQPDSAIERADLDLAGAGPVGRGDAGRRVRTRLDHGHRRNGVGGAGLGSLRRRATRTGLAPRDEGRGRLAICVRCFD